MPINISRVGVRRMGPNSFQWCPATGQGAMGTNWSTGSSIWTWGRTSSLWRWRSTGTGCPGRLWNLLLWRYSRPSWTRSCAACCRWPWFGRGVGLDDPQRSLPTPTILWFCDNVALAFSHIHRLSDVVLLSLQKRLLYILHFNPEYYVIHVSINYTFSRLHNVPVLIARHRFTGSRISLTN